MSSKKKKFEQQIQQNKINRVTNKNTKYNKKMSKSDENYIKGNYTKSVNQTVYGVKKNLAEGRKVHGYGDDYIDTKGMKRSRYIKKQNGENPYEAKYAYQTGKPKYVQGGTRADGTKYDGFYSNKRLLKDYEKESYKNTGTLNNKEYMPKQKYALMSSHKWDNAEKFSDHLNTKVWDGIETAKANQRKGKHISNALEYIKGGAKDVILDPAMDFAKTLGAIGGYTVSGLAGLKTDLDNSISALTDTKRTLKDYTGGKSAFVENIKDNKKSLDKTGFGLDFAHYFKKDKERADKLIEQEFKDKGKIDELNNFKKFNKDNEKLIQNSLNVAGFVSDIIMPSPIEDKIVDGVKLLGKNSVKSFKELKNGTANLATGIVPEETAKLMANSKKYAGKGRTGASDDVFYSNKKVKSATDKLLDDDYKKTLLKEELKENKNTSKISRFLNRIDTKNVSRYSNEMDKVSDIASDVIKNKKNATINSGSKYKPVSSNHINDDVKNVIKDPELKKYGYDKGNRYYDDYDAEFFKEVDHWQNILDKDPDNRLKNIERMKKYNKEVYDYMQQSVDDSIGSFDAEKFLSDLKKKNEVPQNVSKSPKPTYSKEHHKDNKYWVGLGEEVNNTFDASIKDIENINKTYNKFNKNVIEAKINNTELTKIPGKIKEGRKSLNSKVDRKSIKNIVNHDNVNTEIAIEKLVNIMEGSTPKTIANNSARKFEFGKDVSSLSQNILDGKFDIDNFKKIKDTIVGTNATKAQKIDYINNTLFGGKKVLTRSATKNSIDDFLNSIDEINEVKKVIDNFYETGEYLPISLSKSTREFLGIPNNKQLKITDKKFAGKNIDNPEDIVAELTNTLINKSGSLTDARYWEKQQLLANKYGYKKVQYVKDELDEVTKTLKSLDKKQTTPDVLAQKQELSMRRKQLKKLLDNRQQDWDGILKSMNEVTFDDYIAKEYPDIMNKIDFYKQKNTNPNAFNVEKISNQNNVNRVFSELLGETADANKGKRMNYADFVKEQYETMTLKDKALNNKQWQDELKRRWKEYNLELDGAVDERNIEYLRGEKMRNQIRDGASSVKNNNVGQNSRARQEMLDEVGEHVAPKYTTQELHKQRYDKKILNHQIDNIRKTYDLPKPKVNAKIKLQKGQKLKDLPPVKENLANLRKTIQKEIKYMFENPDKYKEFEGAFKQVKLDYVNSLRSIGVPDDKYFHKVVALQDELKGKMNEILKGGTKNTPLLKMELQKLASRVDETFKGFDDVVLDKIDDVNIRTFDDVVTGLNKADNPFDKLLNDNPFDVLDDFDEDALMNGDVLPSNDEVVTISDFFKKLDKNKVDDKPIKEMTRDKRPIPSPSDLINLGMSKDEAFEAINKMMSGEMEIPNLKYEKKVGRDGYTRYERKGIDLNNPSDDIVRKPLDYSTIPRTQKELDVINKDNTLRERKRVGNVDSIEFQLDNTPLPKIPNASNMSDYDSKQLQGILRHGTPQEKRIAKRLLEGRGIEIPKEQYNVVSGSSPLDDILRIARESEDNFTGSLNGVDVNRGNYDMSGIDYSSVPRTQKELERFARDNALRERRRVGNVDTINFEVDNTPLPKSSNQPNMSNYGDRELLGILRHGAPQDKRIARRLLDGRGINVTDDMLSSSSKGGTSPLDDVLRVARENEDNVGISNFNGVDPNKGNYNMSGIDYSGVHRTDKELKKLTKDNALREQRRIGNVDKIEFELDTTPLPKLTEPNAPNMSNYDNKYLQSVLKNGTNEEKRIARRLLKNRGVDIPKQNTPLTKLVDEAVEETPVKFEDFLKEKNIGTDDVVEQFAKGEEEIYGRALTKSEIKANQQKLEKPKYKDNEIYDIYKRWLNSYKKGLTVYNPGWHVQNFFQNKGQNYLALGADALLPQTEAKNILKQINGKGGKNGFIKNTKTKQTYSYDEIGKLAQELGVVDGLGEDVRNARGIFPRLEKQIDNSPLMKWLETNEQTARLNHFIKQIERGMSPEDASKSVNKYLFDYSKKNKVDDFMGDFVDPFWTFHKNNAKLMYGSMFEHPGKINSIIRGTRGLENGIPEEQRQNEESKYGKIQKPYANLTDSVNGDQYNYLYKQNMFPNVEDAIPFERDDIENKMNPILRMLIQQSRGEGNFGNKIVDVEEGEKPGWNEITKEQRMKEVLMDLNPFMPNAVKAMDKILERQQKAEDGKQSKETSDKQAFMDFINYITGNKGNWYRNLDL